MTSKDEKDAGEIGKKVTKLWKEHHLEIVKLPGFWNNQPEGPHAPFESDFVEKYFEKFNAMLAPGDMGLTKRDSYLESSSQEMNLHYKSDLPAIEMNLQTPIKKKQNKHTGELSFKKRI